MFVKLFTHPRLIVLVVIYFIPSLIFSDVLHLKNGDAIRGTIIIQTKKNIKIKTKYGIIKIPKDEIKKVIITQIKKKDEFIYLKTKNGKRFKGVFIRFDSQYVYLIILKKIKKISKRDIHIMSWEPFSIEREKIYYKQIARWDVVWRSALLPSWGQFYDGQTTKGIVVATIVGGLILSSVGMQLDYMKKKNNYDNAGYHNVSLYETAESARNRVNLFVVLTLSAWFLNIADSIIFSRSRNQEVRREMKLTPVFNSSSGAGFEFNKKF